MLSKRFLTCLAIVALAAPLFADAPGVFAITGGTVHPVSGPEIANGTVVIRDGLIEAVGANVAIPSDATVIDAKGKHVYPGLIDAQTSIGFPSATPAPRRRGGQRQTPTETLPETTPAFVAMREAKLSDDDVETKRATGVTTILTVPAFGIFNGQSVIVDLGEGSMESRVIRSGATQQISFLPRPAWTFPDSLMGVVADIRQTMLDAQQYAAAHAVYDKNPSGFKRPDESAALAALGPVLRRDVPVVFVADSELMMRRVMALAKEFNLRFVLSGARQAYKMPANLKSVPLLVSVKWPTPPATKEDRDEQPLRVIRDRQLQPTSPAVLQKNGVLFALVSGAGKSGDFLPASATRSTTVSPPTMRCAPSRFRPHESSASIASSAHSTAARSPTSSSPTSRSSRKNLDGENVSGTFSGDRGSGDISEGTFDGTTLDFSLTARAKAETDSWVFHGMLTGTKIQGTVSTTLGTFPFSGSKGK